jgi:hypothetical protein
MRPVCKQGLCVKKAAKDSVFCPAHRRLKPRAYPEGTRVVFAPGPVSGALYSTRPSYGSRGVVVSVPLPGGKRTFLAGPGGGLLYVKWEGYASNGSRVCGVSPRDCYRETR